MRTRLAIALLIFMMVQAVLFGVGVVAVLSSSLAEDAATLIPVVIAVSIVVSSIVSWVMAPRLRARYWRRSGRDPQGADRIFAALS